VFIKQLGLARKKTMKISAWAIKYSTFFVPLPNQKVVEFVAAKKKILTSLM